MGAMLLCSALLKLCYFLEIKTAQTLALHHFMHKGGLLLNVEKWPWISAAATQQSIPGQCIAVRRDKQKAGEVEGNISAPHALLVRCSSLPPTQGFWLWSDEAILPFWFKFSVIIIAVSRSHLLFYFSTCFLTVQSMAPYEHLSILKLSKEGIDVKRKAKTNKK